MTVVSDAPAHARREAGIATVNGLLRCWARENDLEVGESGLWRLDLPASGTSLHVEVLYSSRSGHHRFGEVRLATGLPVNAVALVALLALEASAGRSGDSDAVRDLVVRVADSEQRAARHIEFRSADGQPAATPFLEAEQALVLGHPLHPAPKSRPALSEQEGQRYSPELRGSFVLHWFAADRSVVSSGGPAEALLKEFAPEVPGDSIAIPAHPWQARDVQERPEIARLLEEGLLRDLGPSGPEWFPTASLRTLYRPDAAIMLKTSLGLPITNSKRENLSKELRRGEEIARLLDAGLADEFAQAHPGFGIVRDPAWLAVDTASGNEGGLELVIRDNPFSTADRAMCVAGVLAERPDRERSLLAEVIETLVAATGRTAADIAEEWCQRYFDHVIAPVLWLYRGYGLGLEAHQQNTLVVLDQQGWPCGGWYRDNQGYYISQRRVGELERFVPGIGIAGENRCADEVIDERLGYYIGINNLLGLVGAFGSQGLASEDRLLAALRERLSEYSAVRLAAWLADEPVLRCKANLRTRIDGLDELVGPLETQSVYCDLRNPFLGVRR